MHFPIVLAALLVLGSDPQEPQPSPAHLAPATCPAGNAGTRRIVDRFLSRAGYAQFRTQTGTTGLAPTNVRLLADAQDSAACSRLNGIYGNVSSEWVTAYYKAGSRYFVAVHRADSRVWMGTVPLYILDQNFTQVGSYAM